MNKARLMCIVLGFLLLPGMLLPAQEKVNGQRDIEELKTKAEKGDATAQYNLGLSYGKGEGVPQDHVEAVKWFRKAAEHGIVDSQTLLGVCYYRGEGVQQDYQEAIKWFGKAAGYGNAPAQIMLGACYMAGQGVPLDDAEAAKWYRKAADQGIPIAQYELARYYASGQGVKLSLAEAVKWFRKAADQGHADAQAYLGACFADGEGVPQNDLDAYVWLSLSTAQGHKEAAQMRDRVANRMSRAEVVEGQRRAAAFVAKPSTPAQQVEFNAGDLSSLIGNQPKGSATGFFITDDGYLVSSFHVVEGSDRVKVRTKAGDLSAQVIRTDPSNDLALLKISGTSWGLPIISSRTVKLGSTVATVGFPNIGLQGFAPKLAKGEIAALTGAQDDPRYFQISVPIQPGNSGGALVDDRGNVIGVVSAKLSAQAALDTSGVLPENVNYAVKSSFLLSFLESAPEVGAKLKQPNTTERKFEDVVKEVQEATTLVLVY